jgi:hypothetical protein
MEEAPVAASERPEQIEVRGGLDPALGVPGSQGQIGDDLVHGARWIHGEVKDPGDPLVGAGRAEAGASEHGLASLDLESRHRHGILPRPQRAAMSPTTRTRVRSELPGRYASGRSSTSTTCRPSRAAPA